MLLVQAAAFALVVGEREQVHLTCYELVAALLRFLVGEIKQIGQIAPDLHFSAVTFHFWQARHGIVQRGLERIGVAARAGQQRTCAAVGIVKQGQQQVLWLDELVIRADGQTLGIGQGLLQLGGKFVETHDRSLTEMIERRSCGGIWRVFNPFCQKNICANGLLAFARFFDNNARQSPESFNVKTSCCRFHPARHRRR